jgi:hypothetical protein
MTLRFRPISRQSPRRVSSGFRHTSKPSRLTLAVSRATDPSGASPRVHRFCALRVHFRNDSWARAPAYCSWMVESAGS